MFILLKNKKILINLAKILAKIIYNNINLFLIAELGLGKTLITKSIIKKFMKYKDIIKSPTYNIVETYKKNNIKINHFDLYRLKNLNDFKNIEINYYLNKKCINIIEWPGIFINYFFKQIIIYIFYYTLNKNRIIFINNNTINITILLK